MEFVNSFNANQKLNYSDPFQMNTSGHMYNIIDEESHKVLQKRKKESLCLPLAKNSDLEGRLDYLKSKSSDTSAMQITIREGLNIVTDRFQRNQLLKTVWTKFVNRVDRQRRIRKFGAKKLTKKTRELKKIVYFSFKWFAKTESLVRDKRYKRVEAYAEACFKSWRIYAGKELLIQDMNAQRELRLKHSGFQRMFMFPLINKQVALRKQQALVHYSHYLGIRIMRKWNKYAKENHQNETYDMVNLTSSHYKNNLLSKSMQA